MTHPKKRCALCGASVEQTPSGRRKHEATRKHLSFAPDPTAAHDKLGSGEPKASNGESEAPAEVWCSFCELPSVVMRNGDPFCAEHDPEGEGPTEPPYRPSQAIQEQLDVFQVGVWDEGPDVREVRKRIEAAEAAVRDADERVAKYRRYVRHGELHNEKLLPKYQQQLAEAEQTRTAAVSLAEEAQTALRAEMTARNRMRKAYWERVHQIAIEATTVAMVGEAHVPKSFIEEAVYTLVVRIGELVVHGPAPKHVEDGVTLSEILVPGRSVDAVTGLGFASNLKVAAVYALQVDVLTGLSKR